MLNFAIYKYVLIESNEKTLFKKDGASNPQEIFGGLLGGKKLNIYKTGKDGEVVTYPNDILCTRDGVTMITLCNVKYVKLVKKYEEKREESNPWCNVVIDNRPDVAQIAIEHSAAFDGNPDKVRDLLRELFHNQLSEYGLDIEINAKIRTEDFWEMVDWQCRTRHDTVSSVVLDFLDPRRAGPIDASDEMKQNLKMLSTYFFALGAVKGSLKFEADEHGTLSMDRKKEDLARLVALCGNNGYNIAVHFREMGVYRYGDQVRSTSKIDESKLADFSSGQKTIDDKNESGIYALIQWLDDVRDETKNYDYAKPTPKSRKKKCKEVV